MKRCQTEVLGVMAVKSSAIEIVSGIVNILRDRTTQQPTINPINIAITVNIRS